MTCLFNKDFFTSKEDVAIVLPRKPQPLFPEHSHEFNEVFIVESGYGVHEMNGKVHMLTPGTVFYIKPHDYHLFGDVQNLNLVNLIYSHEHHFRFIKNIHELIPSFDDPCWNITAKVRKALIKILDQYRILESSNQYTLDREFIFFDVMRTLRHTRFQDKENNSNSDKLKHLMTYLSSNYDLDIDWLRLTQRFKISYRTLQRQFNEQLGTTPQKYLIYLRLINAQKLLKNSELSITEIAYKTGFNDSNYFASVFTKSLGLSPSMFRKHASNL